MDRWLRCVAGVIAVAALVLVVPAGPAMAAESFDGDIRLTVTTSQPTFAPGEPVRLALAVTNSSAAACSLATLADGAVRVTSVRRDGAELSPALGRTRYPDSMGTTIAASRVTAEPGATVTVDVVAIALGGGSTESVSGEPVTGELASGDPVGSMPEDVLLSSVVPSAAGGGLAALWPLGVPAQYEVTLAYAVPAVEPAGDIARCTGTAAGTVVFTVGDVGGSTQLTWLWLGIGALGLAGGLVVVVILLRRRRRTGAAAVLLLAALAVGVGGSVEPAQAIVVVNPSGGSGAPEGVDFGGAVRGCLAGFRAPGGDPAGILDRLEDFDSPRVTIVPSDAGSNSFSTPDSRHGEGSSVITWNPTSTAPYQDGIARDPCASLYHELSHSHGISTGNEPEGTCGATGIARAEVEATFAENRYRASRGLPQRTQYGTRALPESLDACDEPVPPRGPGPERVYCEDDDHCGRTSGDPHLVTFDRVYYDFQAAGEFVLVRATSADALEVQTRQSPLGTTGTISVNTGVAFRVGEHTVSMVLTDGVSQVHVDGKPVALAAGATPLPGGGEVVRRDSDIGAADGYEVRWPDGSTVALDDGGYGYRLLVRLDADRAGKVAGLLGDFDGDPTNDLKLASGTAVEPPYSYEELYPSYADSWRVAADASLFTYADGTSTETFTDRDYPKRSVTLADLDAQARERAERACRWAGVADGWLFAECLFDVAVTGRPELAVATAATARTAPPAGAPIAAIPIAEGPVTPGAAGLTFPGKVGDQVVVHVIAPTLASGCSPVRLVDPGGDVVARGCFVGGGSLIERTNLDADGEYQVVVDARPGDTGRAMVRVYTAEDIEATIVPGGEAVMAALDRPGSQARYTFTGAAGQRVFVEAIGGTLPDQCSPLRLEDPEGGSMGATCLRDGRGHIGGVALPAHGTYTVVLNPSDATIGTIHIRLFASTDQVGAIILDGAPVVAKIDTPGAITAYEFVASAGTSVTVKGTDATLPNSCSPLGLFTADGDRLAVTCLIGGTATITSEVLPDDGRYRVVVDPVGAGTGEITLTLRSG